MPPLYDQSGPQAPWNSLNAGVIPADVYGIAVNSFVNRTPLFSRLAVAHCGSLSFLITKDNYRPASTTVNNSGVILVGATSFTVTDGSFFMSGDVIEVNGEGMLVTGVSGNVLTVSKGYGGTTAAQQADGSTVYLIGNSRTGAEINQTAISRVPTTIEQYLQTFQHPWSVGGSLATATNYAVPPGVAGVVGREKFLAMQDCADDIERNFYYGLGVKASAATTKQEMKGLRALIVTNKVTGPTNASAYKPTDFIRDVLQGPRSQGGAPDVVLLSAEFMQGLATWGHAAQRVEAGSTVFGTPIDLFEAPFLGGVSLIFCPQLRPYTAIGLTSAEVRNRVKRPMDNKDRGSRGDAVEGDIIAEMAIELDNEHHHSFVTGITAFSAT